MIVSKALLWVDIETTGITNSNDYSFIQILEVGAILTNMSLEPLEQINGLVTPTQEAIVQLKAPENAEAFEMHKKSGLLAELTKGETQTLEEIETEILEAIDERVQQGGLVVLAGSGIAAFDFPVIKEKMPRLSERLAYYSFDVGAARRVNLLLSGGQFRTNVNTSYGELKEHRALADIKAHLQEAVAMRDIFGTLYGNVHNG